MIFYFFLILNKNNTPSSNKLLFDQLKGREFSLVWSFGPKAHLITKGLWAEMDLDIAALKDEEIKFKGACGADFIT